MDWIDQSKIRIPVRDLSDTGRDTLIKLAKAGLKPAVVELERRGELITKYNVKVSHKNKTEWDVSQALVRRM